MNFLFKRKKKRRLGRGNSSKKGNTCCRGNKGQKSRSGYSKKFLFSGGQTKLNISMPKIGFKKKRRNKSLCVNKEVKFIIFKKETDINFKSIYLSSFFYNANAGRFARKKIFFSGGFILKK
ncbi:LSU ribosomal protein L15p (L27Ae) [Candidatus Vidania fulgoroideae]|nr:LSU ribosomal protein L15p (L27Ae) [Candidatus Vidania fulgoroideae]